MSGFAHLPTTQKGTVGERYVCDVLTSMGWHIYAYVAKQSHPIDLLAITPERRIIAVEVKCKPARVYYPDTGMDYNDYLAYHQLSNTAGIPVLVFFVDYSAGVLRAQYLDKLSQPVVIQHNGRELVYPLVEQNKWVYFPLSVLDHWAVIPPVVCAEMARYGRNGKYQQPLPPRNRSALDNPDNGGV